MNDEIRLEQFYPHPPDRIWQALTDTAALADWLMPNDFEPRVGHKFQFRFKPMPGWRGFVECEVIELDEPRRLAYTWLGDADWTQPTVVTWTLQAVEAGTLLRLEHTGFEKPWGPKVSAMLGQGWKKMLAEKIPQVLGRFGPGGYSPASSAERGPAR